MPSATTFAARSSPVARLALVVTVGLLVYASLFPVTGWFDPGVSALAWIGAPFPPYWTAAEIGFNVAVYAPFGLLAVWAVRPRLIGWRAVAAALAGAALLSGTMESLQTFLPGRVASNVDFTANTAGALCGAVLGALSARTLVDYGWEARWSDQVLQPRAGGMVMLAALWLLVQIPPQPMLFGTGDLRIFLPFDAVLPPAWLPAWAMPSPPVRLRAEQACTALALVGVLMLVLHCVRPTRLRLLLPPLFVIVALSVKAAAQPLATPGGPEIFSWMTPGAWRGLVWGTVVAMALAHASAEWQRRVAVGALTAQVLIVNLVPVDRYFAATTASGRTGMLYAEAMTWELSALWPFAALIWVLWRASRPAAIERPVQRREDA